MCLFLVADLTEIRIGTFGFRGVGMGGANLVGCAVYAEQKRGSNCILGAGCDR